MSQRQLSRLSGVSLVTINAMKQNRTKQVSLLTLTGQTQRSKGQDGGRLCARRHAAKARQGWREEKRGKKG